MKTTSNDPKDRIVQAIAACQDDGLRAVLLLLLAVLEEIGSKIDTVMHDEKALREIVLNGHTSTHEADHDWISSFRAHANEYPEDHAWIRMRRAEEEAAKQSKRKVGENVMSHIIVAVLSVAFTALVAHYLGPVR